MKRRRTGVWGKDHTFGNHRDAKGSRDVSSAEEGLACKTYIQLLKYTLIPSEA